MTSKKRKLRLLQEQVRPPARLDDNFPLEIRHKIQNARTDLFTFCNLRDPKFFKPERDYLVRLCREFQDFYESDELVMLVNLPPRHGKSYSAQQFSQWVYGVNPSEKIMTGSYNEDLSQTFAQAVRNGISEKKADDDIVVYSDIFPDTKIQYGDASAKRWSLEGKNTSYLATSPSGTATGFGASLIIIDDLIKNAMEAFNETELEKQWNWFTNTMLSRLEEGGKIIIIMTRWSSKDLAGRAKKHFTQLGIPIREVVMKAVQDDGSMLCSDVLSKESYEMKTATMAPEIASANYQQIPLDLKGCLYTSIATYTQLPELTRILNYTDTADTGSDKLCSIVFGVYNHEAYILDVLDTKDPMEITEPATARLLNDHRVQRARIESNNGGRGFARSVRRHLESMGNYYTEVATFTQKKNKQARILSNATWIMQHCRMPADWKYKWPAFYEAITTYQREGKNRHDDEADALTGVAETMIMIGEI